MAGARGDAEKTPQDKGLRTGPATVCELRPPAAPGSSRDRVAAAQRRGFEAILERDVERAIAVFQEAYDIWPVYPNVDAILRLLKKAASA